MSALSYRRMAIFIIGGLGLALAGWYWSPVEREKRRDRDVARCIQLTGSLTADCLMAYGWSGTAAHEAAMRYLDAAVQRITR